MEFSDKPTLETHVSTSSSTFDPFVTPCGSAGCGLTNTPQTAAYHAAAATADDGQGCADTAWGAASPSDLAFAFAFDPFIEEAPPESGLPSAAAPMPDTAAEGEPAANAAQGNTKQFIAACAEGDVVSVYTLLELRGARAVDVHARDAEALAKACQGGHEDIVRTLLALDGDRLLDIDAHDGRALRMACREGHLGVVRALLGAAPQRCVDLTAKKGAAFISACAAGHVEIMQALLQTHGPSPPPVAAKNHLAFCMACRNGHVQCVRELLKLTGQQAVNVHARNSDALVSACANGHLPVVRELLALRGQRCIRVHAQGDAALLRACEAGHTGVVQALLQLRGEQGFDMTLVGPAALRAAVRGGHSGAVCCLLRATGSWFMDAPEWTEEQPLLIACSRGHTELVRYMLSLKGPLNVDLGQNDCGAFFAACHQGHLPVVREMLQLTGERAIDLNVDRGREFRELFMTGPVDVVRAVASVTGPLAATLDNYNCRGPFDKPTLLGTVCKEGSLDRLHILLEQAAIGRVDVNRGPGIAIEAAAIRGDVRIVQALLEYDGPVRVEVATPSSLRTPLAKACYHGHIELVKFLLSLQGDRAVDVHERNSDAWVSAVAGGHADIVKLLLSLEGERRVHVCARSHDALYFASASGDVELVKLLLSLDGDRRLSLNPEPNGRGALIACARNGCPIEMLRLLLELDGDRRVNVHVNDGEVLLLPALEGNIEAVQLLLSLTGDRRMHLQGDRDFARVCANGNLDIVRLFLALEDERAAQVTEWIEEGFLAACDAEKADIACELAALTGERAIDVAAHDFRALKAACKVPDSSVLQELMPRLDSFAAGQREECLEALTELCWKENLKRQYCIVLRSGVCSIPLRDLLLCVPDAIRCLQLPEAAEPEDPVLAQALIQQVFIHCLQWEIENHPRWDAVKVFTSAVSTCLAVCACCPASGLSHVRRAMYHPTFTDTVWLGRQCLEVVDQMGDVAIKGFHIPVVPIPGAPPLPQLAGLLDRQGRMAMLLHRAARLAQKDEAESLGAVSDAQGGAYEQLH